MFLWSVSCSVTTPMASINPTFLDELVESNIVDVSESTYSSGIGTTQICGTMNVKLFGIPKGDAVYFDAYDDCIHVISLDREFYDMWEEFTSEYPVDDEIDKGHPLWDEWVKTIGSEITYHNAWMALSVCKHRTIVLKEEFA